MLKEVLPGLWVDNVATRFPGVSEINYSFVKGAPGCRSLLVDAGLPDEIAPGCREALLYDMEELGLSFHQLDCVITHSHRDHVGQAKLLNERGARVLINPVDMSTEEEQINHELLHPELRRRLFRLIGLELADQETYEAFWRAADEFSSGFEDCWNFSWDPISPGEELHYGEYRFTVVPLPGHTQGQIGLWDRTKKLLFSGDQLVHGITPIVGDAGNYPEGLDEYLNSMRDVKHLYGSCLFIPGHGRPFRNPTAEVDAVVQSYLDKCSIMYDILRHSEQPLSIRGIAMRTYGRYGRELSDSERRSCILIWFKTGACLNYMKKRHLLHEEMTDGVSMWSAV